MELLEGNNFSDHCQEGAKVTEQKRSIKTVALAKPVITVDGWG